MITLSSALLSLPIIFGSTPIFALEVNTTTFVNDGYYRNIISDGHFTDKDSMSVAEIQDFLEERGSYLASAPSSQLGANANDRSAARIIWDAAHGYGEASGTLNGVSITTTTGTISPRVILITLQKEQSLITRTTHDQRALDCAMGYEGGNGCTWMFDNKPNWKGFTNQVEWGSWQLRYNYEIAAKSASWWDTYYSYASPMYYYQGNTLSFADPTGVYSVYFTNRATAALYRYTPHVFNGNYNFWKNSVNWFGVLSSGGGGASSDTNDTASVTTATYKGAFKITGVKSTETKAYFQGRLIADLGDGKWEAEFEPQIGRVEYRIEYKNSGGGTVASKTITIDRRKVGDINGDGRVELLDLSILSDSWGQNIQGDAWVNLNPEDDNIVDILDLSLIATNWEG